MAVVPATMLFKNAEVCWARFCVLNQGPAMGPLFGKGPPKVCVACPSFSLFYFPQLFKSVETILNSRGTFKKIDRELELAIDCVYPCSILSNTHALSWKAGRRGSYFVRGCPSLVFDV